MKFWIQEQKTKSKLSEVDEKLLSESRNRIKLTYDDTKKNRFTLERMKSQTQKLKAL